MIIYCFVIYQAKMSCSSWLKKKKGFRALFCYVRDQKQYEDVTVFFMFIDSTIN